MSEIEIVSRGILLKIIKYKIISIEFKIGLLIKYKLQQ